MSLLKQPAAHQNHFQYVLMFAIEPAYTEHFSTIKVPLLERPVDTGLTRSMRKRREPARFRDDPPVSTAPSQMRHRHLARNQRLEATDDSLVAAQPEHDPELLPAEDFISGTASEDPQRITTDQDTFGVFRKYSSVPSHNPDDLDPFEDAVPHETSPTERIGSNLHVSSTEHESNPLADSENPTQDLLLGWWFGGFGDGLESLNRLVECLKSPYFDLSQLKDFNAVTAVRRFEKRQGLSKSKPTLVPGDGWKTGSVKIRVPCAKVKQREEEAPEFIVDGVLYRDAVEVITKELQDPDSFERIHLKPFEEWWKPSESDDPIRVYSDVYTSDAMLEADQQLQGSQESAPSFGPQLETFAVSVGLYTDSTNLTAFSNASMWPMYMFIGNESKYLRSKPSSFSAHHIAYLPTVRGPMVLLFVTFSPIACSCQTQSRSSTMNIINRLHQLTCSHISSESWLMAACG